MHSFFTRVSLRNVFKRFNTSFTTEHAYLTAHAYCAGDIPHVLAQTFVNLYKLTSTLFLRNLLPDDVISLATYDDVIRHFWYDVILGRYLGFFDGQAAASFESQKRHQYYFESFIIGSLAHYWFQNFDSDFLSRVLTYQTHEISLPCNTLNWIARGLESIATLKGNW